MRFLSFCDKKLLATSTAVILLLPDLITIAKSSASLNAVAPYFQNFSYGLSDSGNSFVVNE